MIYSIFYMASVSMTNSQDLIANTISVIDKDKVVDLKEVF